MPFHLSYPGIAAKAISPFDLLFLYNKVGAGATGNFLSGPPLFDPYPPRKKEGICVSEVGWVGGYAKEAERHSKANPLPGEILGRRKLGAKFASCFAIGGEDMPMVSILEAAADSMAGAVA